MNENAFTNLRSNPAVMYVHDWPCMLSVLFSIVKPIDNTNISLGKEPYLFPLLSAFHLEKHAVPTLIDNSLCVPSEKKAGHQRAFFHTALHVIIQKTAGPQKHWKLAVFYDTYFLSIKRKNAAEVLTR
ncbi:hypothetical protein P4H61_03670 [Paenibacillus peoriae]|uniref:hypothetical protein n=1 Tax=Paenibacillus peoriae TaxID=59893 RepID=UPI00026C593E|nr:hypothetical protein [Paenibacillus peoriae]MEC0180594.1 hypothetical protein [Paenibacillus peoriae]